MRKFIGLILLAVVASAGCTGDANSEKVSITSTTVMPTTSTTMVVASADCLKMDADLTDLWETSDAIAERAEDAGVAGDRAISGARADDARGNIKVTRLFITLCGREFPPEKTAEYEKRIERVSN